MTANGITHVFSKFFAVVGLRDDRFSQSIPCLSPFRVFFHKKEDFYHAILQLNSNRKVSSHSTNDWTFAQSTQSVTIVCYDWTFAKSQATLQ